MITSEAVVVLVAGVTDDVPKRANAGGRPQEQRNKASLELGIGYPKVTNHDITTYLSAPCVLRSKRRHVETESPPPPSRDEASGCLHVRARLQAPFDDDEPPPPATLFPRILHNTHTLDVAAS
jgi:hypothetical protein